MHESVRSSTRLVGSSDCITDHLITLPGSLCFEGWLSPEEDVRYGPLVEAGRQAFRGWLVSEGL